MKNKISFAAAALLAFPAAAFCGLNTAWYDGFSFSAGMNHVAEADSSIFGVHNRENNEGAIQTQNFDPKNDFGYSLGAEYNWAAGGIFTLGAGIEYNSPSTLERVYGNNMLKRRVSAQKEVYKGLSTIPVYVTAGYNFRTASSSKPFIFGRFGYSFNAMDKYSMTLYEEGPMPLAGSPVEGAGANITRTSHVKDLEASPYYGLGMGVRFKDHFFLQALYSYTSIRFRAFYPTSYTYYDTALAAVVTNSFQVIETHQLNYSRVQLNLGYSFGPQTQSGETAGGGIDPERSLLGGFHLLAGFNRNLPMTSELTHINGTVVTQAGEVARSVQNVVSRPEQDLSVSAGAEYLYPVSKHWDLGAGVLYNFRHDYEKVQTDSSGNYTQIRIEKFNNTVPYLGGRYYFEPGSGAQPYLLGRLGYSYNNFKYNKYSNGVRMSGVSAADIKNGLYTAFGMGARFSDHIFGELSYDVTKSGHKKPVYYGDSEEFKTTLQGIHFNLGYNF